MKNIIKVLGTVTILAVVAVLTASCEMEIPVSGVTLDKQTASLAVGENATLTAIIEPSDATNQKMTWSSNDPAKVSVSSRGEIKGVAIGNAFITVTADDGGFSATCSVTVTGPATIPVTGVTINKPSTSTSLVIGGTETLTATVAPDNATNKNVTWNSSDPAKVSVSASGVITGLAVGTATITATTVDGNFTATCTVNVNSTSVAVTGVTLKPTIASITIGSIVALEATIEPANATSQSVTWSSSTPDVAMVLSDGRVFGMKAGSATITVTADGGKTATCAVTVSSNAVAVTSISLNKPSTGIRVGATETLIATVAPDNATNKNVTWRSSDETKATVSNGIVSGVKEGDAIITATADGDKTATCAVKVSADAVAVTGVTLNKANTGLLIGGTETLIATIAPLAATNQSVTWSSSATAIATVTNGIVSGVAVGTATITVTADGGKIATCAVKVSATAVSVISVSVKTSTNITAGNYEPLVCTFNPNDATNQNVTWTSSAPAIATVSETGVVSGVSPGSATITVSTEDGAKTSFCNVTVSAVSVTGVTLDKTTLALNVGATGALTPTITPPNATNKAVIWSSSAPTVATVSASGLVTGVAAGSATITVKTANSEKTASCAVTVTAIPTQTISVVINETNPQVGMDLTTDVIKSFAGTVYYQWYRDGVAIDYRTYSNYYINLNDAGKTITVKVTCGDQTAEASVSVPDITYTVVVFKYSNYFYAQISYNNDIYDIPEGFYCQWYRGSDAISGETSHYYYIQPADAGKSIKVRVSGNGKNVDSNPLNVPKADGSDVTPATLGLYLATLSENSEYNPHIITTLKVNINDDLYSIGEAIRGTYNKYISLDLSTSNITAIPENAFYNCRSLISITIPNSVTSIEYNAFYDCNSLTSITIPSNVTSIGDYAFYYCRSLTSITIPNNVTSIGNYTFSSCRSLTSITIPNNVTSIGNYAFSSCNSLTSINIPDNVTSIGDYAFYVCESFTSINIPDSVTSIGRSAFSGCNSLTQIEVDASNTEYSSDNGVLYNKDITTLFTYPSGKTGTFYNIPDSVTIIRETAFLNTSSLTSVNIPDSVTTIEWGAFGYTSLTSVTIPNSVTSIDYYAFGECTKLNSVTFEGTIPSEGFSSDAFMGNLRVKFYETNGTIGTLGTYTTTAPVKQNSVWTKSP